MLNREAQVLKATLMAIVVLGCSNAPGAASQTGDAANAPSLTLSVFGQQTLILDRHKPLEVKVVLSNPRARVVAAENRRATRLAEYITSDDIKAKTQEQQDFFSQNFAQQTIPVIQIGTDRDPIESLIDLSCQSQSDNTVSIKARAILPPPTRAQLDDKQVAIAEYLVDPSELAALQNGPCRLTVKLNSEKKPGMWNGQLSDTLQVVLKDDISELSNVDRQKRILAYGRIYLLDDKTDLALECAEQVSQIDELSIAAEELKGEIYFKRADWKNSENAFKKSLENFDKTFGEHGKSPDRAMEPPVTIYRYLQEVREARKLAELN